MMGLDYAIHEREIECEKHVRVSSRCSENIDNDSEKLLTAHFSIILAYLSSFPQFLVTLYHYSLEGIKNYEAKGCKDGF